MANPFEQRATEYLRDDEAFLAIVTPEPLAAFFQGPAAEGRLYDRLTMVLGTPGSGKTTLARLFEFPTVSTLVRNRGNSSYRPLIDTLTACGGISQERPALIGGRLPLESEYRDFWELGYSDGLRNRLMIALLQARMVLAWLRNLQTGGITLDDVEIVPREGAEAALASIGGTTGPDVLACAREVERAIYAVSAALVPPDTQDIEARATAAYQPFDVIEAFRVVDGTAAFQLRPLAIFDDVHTLHTVQFQAVRRWLVRRELKISRWLLTRLDALTPRDVLLGRSVSDGSEGIKESRDITVIAMQNTKKRGHQRRLFRKMATDMAGRYLAQMPIFNRRRLGNLGDLLLTQPPVLSPAQQADLKRRLTVAEARYGVPPQRRQDLLRKVTAYLKDKADRGADMKYAMMCVLYARYGKRYRGPGLFGTMGEVPSRRPLKVDGSVAEGARIHLLHRYRRPYFFGIDALCDASSENAEQFLQLAARLVAQSETQLIRRNKDGALTSSDQHRLLVERAGELVEEWDFPDCRLVRHLAKRIAEQCLTKSLEANASLGGGANAIGIPQSEFTKLLEVHAKIARVLKFGVAYNAFVIVPNHRTKNRLWCLIELGGVLLVHHKLTLKRGGFLERRSHDLARWLEEE